MDTKILKENQIYFEKDISLKRKTWIKTGGIAKYWIEPNTIDQLSIITKYLNDNNIFFELVGHSSNLYFLNNYNPDIFITTRKVKNFVDENDILICECGCIMKNLSRYCVNKGYKGYEGLIDLPGTVAGAVVNNSGCFGSSIYELLIKVDYLRRDGEIITLYKEDLKYKKRSSVFKRKENNEYIGGVILKVYLKKEHSFNPEDLLIKASNIHLMRQETQEGPKLNLGSSFSNLSYKLFPKLVLKITSKLCSILELDLSKRSLLIRNITIFIFGGISVNKYVSYKTINCFIWKDSKSDIAFNKYLKFINRITDSSCLEIEIKSGEFNTNNKLKENE